MLSNRTLTEEQTVIRRQFTDFFESERYEERYHERIQTMIVAGKARLLLDMGDLLDYIPISAGGLDGSENGLGGGGGGEAGLSLGASIIRQPGKYIPLLELALHDVVLRQQPEYLKVDYRSRAVHAGFEGPVGRVLSPRELYARHLNTMVALEGIVIRQSTNRPRVLETVHYCAETNKFTKKEFRDQLTPMIDSSHLPTVNVMPKTDMEGHALRTELGLCTFMDSQCAVLQEAPERAPTGQLPRNVEVRFDDDLVDAVKPGDRVLLVGVYMPYTTADSKSFQSIVLVNHVVSTQTFTFLTRPLPALEDRLTRFARKCLEQHGPSGVLDTLAKAVAPTIYGMTPAKQAILLMMVGGVERMSHHSHVRGDINVLLVGEPSTAKSQLLRFVLGVAPLALSTTGKGSSGVGLTAAVATDSYTGERSLSAGAMVLADRGILCIDEFDKMGSQDRVAMHEAMEQQTVTIAKAGIHASLNARCSVLAAANPIYGFYSVQHRLAFNVGLPESLLSRFDLTFIILDQHSSDYNRRIGYHILRNHMTSETVRYDEVDSRTVVESVETSSNAAARQAGPRRGGGDGNDDEQGTTSVSSFGNGGGEGRLDLRMTTNSTGESIVSVDFLRAFTQLAKRGSPLLTEASRDLVCQHYVQLRAEQQDGGRDGFFITPRTLDAIVRLSTANAKLRLSPTVEEVDVAAAMALLRASVNAATTATQQRRDDNEHSIEEAGGHKRPAAAATSAGAETTATGLEVVPSSMNTTEEAAALRRPRTEAEAGEDGRVESSRSSGEAATTPATVTSGAAMSAVDVHLNRRVVEALKEFQREQRDVVALRELHERLGGGGGAATTSMDALKRSVTQLQGDAFIFEGTEDGGDDTVQFI
ncbi:putative DNA replication licensing factor MCM3 [Leptomonas pyrrhocoris]|uniref:DNA replication licensing factor MCM3 n=1 Tax=Leptomonas pyrrhocoris TaxID=157538 RepID=A0A0M9G7M6_LEPPY|nr:putative DNA replication licensing factor MCM3 [Leptomonas pyrrhocoris]KPA84350.1 putative DNA replication licensing factor MCM3 [Leptomonas pyrrhocoris]|eukprot:XP_015662789.1 putative DNA replication licensing factor MCM3 [Leptomonas pyrrhocoris]